VKAKDLVAKWGKSLLNQYVLTESAGAWPGGVALVVGLEDTSDSAIALVVRSTGRDWMQAAVYQNSEVELLTGEGAAHWPDERSRLMLAYQSLNWANTLIVGVRSEHGDVLPPAVKEQFSELTEGLLKAMALVREEMGK
jgi:hypothetical protein